MLLLLGGRELSSLGGASSSAPYSKVRISDVEFMYDAYVHINCKLEWMVHMRVFALLLSEVELSTSGGISDEI